MVLGGRSCQLCLMWTASMVFYYGNWHRRMPFCRACRRGDETPKSARAMAMQLSHHYFLRGQVPPSEPATQGYAKPSTRNVREQARCVPGPIIIGGERSPVSFSRAICPLGIFPLAVLNHGGTE